MLFRSQDAEDSHVKFYGKRTVGGSVFDLTLSDTVTVADTEKLPINDYQVYVNDVLATLTDITGLELEFNVGGINSQSIISKVNGKNNVVLDNLLFAIS